MAERLGPSWAEPVVLEADDLTPRSDLAAVVALLEAHHPPDAEQAATVERMLTFAADHPDALHRSCTAGHFTGSALVVDPGSRRVVLLFHTKLRRWLQPGGHADGDGNMAGTAWREATEEIGIEGLRVVLPPIDLDIHEIPAGKDPAHLHLDIRFLVLAPIGARVVGNHESESIRWVSESELVDLGADRGLRRLTERGLALVPRVPGLEGWAVSPPGRARHERRWPPPDSSTPST